MVRKLSVLRVPRPNHEDTREPKDQPNDDTNVVISCPEMESQEEETVHFCE